MQSIRKIHWTEHSKIKMRQYGLSQGKLISLLRRPERKEKGIVSGTIALMKTNKTFFKTKKINLKSIWQQRQKAPGEIWLMYKDSKDQRKIISAWRYPGVSKPGDPVPVPNDIREEIMRGSVE